MSAPRALRRLEYLTGPREPLSFAMNPVGLRMKLRERD